LLSIRKATGSRCIRLDYVQRDLPARLLKVGAIDPNRPDEKAVHFRSRMPLLKTKAE
jgi:hypothetical protein